MREIATALTENIDRVISIIFIVPLKKIVPTPLASAMYNACTKDGSIIGPRINPKPMGPG